MRTIATLICGLFLIGGTHLAMDRAPEAVITIEAWSPQEIVDMGWTAHSTTGLDVVGIGELVYLFGEEASGEEVYSWTWSFTAKPDGSNPAPPSLFEQRFTFRPDLAGKYTVQLNISTPSGVSSASVSITAGEYVGVGSMGGATPDFATGQCASCHANQAADYMETRHASKLTREIDGLGSSHYSGSCIECHTVGYNDDVQAVNGGFDDVAADLGWTFPATLESGNWQDIVDNYPDLAQVSNIQCENCHGPGSLHKGNKANIDISVEIGVCAQCHESGEHHIRPTQWKNSGHAQGVRSASTRATGNYAAAEGFGCNGCHSTYGFIARTDPTSDLRDASGQPLITGMQQLTCAGCHDPHSAKNEHQLRRVSDVTLTNGEVITFGGIGKLCMNCHKARENAEEYVAEEGRRRFSGPHHTPQADMLAGTNAIDFGFRLPNSTHKDVLDEACISCHMYETPGAGEPGHNQVGEHSFNVRFNLDDGTEVQNVARCQTCHEPDLESFEDRMVTKDYDGDGTIEGAEDEIEGAMDNLAELLPPLGEPTVSYNSDFNLIQRKALYNYLFVEEDHSHGFHNFQYAINLLLLSADVLNYGVLTEGTIAGVTDVPNDQGKQVMVEWTRFGGDGPSDQPVEVYNIWREGDSAAGKASYRTMGDVPFSTDGSLEGVTASFAGSTWTIVGSAPAAMLDSYSAVVPTLFDGVDATFMVTGHTSVSTIFAAAVPVSGQSVDNLVPQAPSGVATVGSETAIMLKWVAPDDPDIDYYEVYKSTVENFDPTLMDPLAKVVETEFIDQAVVAGGTYFYQVTAYDFSGNRGVFSAEKMATATAIELTGEVPAQFELSQNYPNPFNPTTNIEFAIPEAGIVTITIFDVSGKQVGTLVSEFMQPGRYTLPWNAQALASGVYIYKMESGSFVKTNTMLLIK